MIRFGGAAMIDPQLRAGFARDVALLRLVGMQPVVVHGGGWHIDRQLQQMGIEPRRHRRRRPTGRTGTRWWSALDSPAVRAQRRARGAAGPWT